MCTPMRGRGEHAGIGLKCMTDCQAYRKRARMQRLPVLFRTASPGRGNGVCEPSTFVEQLLGL